MPDRYGNNTPSAGRLFRNSLRRFLRDQGICWGLIINNPDDSGKEPTGVIASFQVAELQVAGFPARWAGLRNDGPLGQGREWLATGAGISNGGWAKAAEDCAHSGTLSRGPGLVSALEWVEFSDVFLSATSPRPSPPLKAWRRGCHGVLDAGWC